MGIPVELYGPINSDVAHIAIAWGNSTLNDGKRVSVLTGTALTEKGIDDPENGQL